MAEQVWKVSFQMAVSAKDFTIGGEGRPLDESSFYYVERGEDETIRIQPLNSKYYPTGHASTLTLEEFLENYTPEPLYFYNRVKPALDEVAHNLGKGEKHLGNEQYAKAETAFKKVLEIDEENIKGIFGLGISCLSLNKMNDALTIFEKLMGLDLAFGPEHTHLFNQFGIQMRKTGLYAEAVRYYEKAIGLNAADEHLFFNASRSHYERMDMVRAYGFLAKALHLKPDFNEGQQLLRALLKTSGLTLAQMKLESLKIATDKDNVGLDLDGAPWLLD